MDLRKYYICNLEICAGPFELNNTTNEVVKRLTDEFENSGRNITADNWYTSYKLTKDLLKKKLMFLGTIRKNKQELPAEFISAKKQNPNSSLFVFQ